MNWGQGIAIFLGCFVTFMGVLVYQTTRSNVDLEAEDYYAQELLYEDQIVANSNGQALDKVLKVEQAGKEIVISLEKKALAQLTEGKVTLYRPNDATLDITFPLSFKNGVASIPAGKLAKGKYEARFLWKGTKGNYAVARDLIIQ